MSDSDDSNAPPSNEFHLGSTLRRSSPPPLLLFLTCHTSPPFCFLISLLTSNPVHLGAGLLTHNEGVREHLPRRCRPREQVRSTQHETRASTSTQYVVRSTRAPRHAAIQLNRISNHLMQGRGDPTGVTPPTCAPSKNGNSLTGLYRCSGIHLINLMY